MKRKLLVFFATLLVCCSLKTFAQYANTTLSNLTSPTAVNVNLLPATSSTAGSPSYIHLGSADKNWGFLYFRGFAYRESNHIIQINNPDTYLGMNAGPEEHYDQLPEFGYNTGIGYNSMVSSGGGGNTALGAYSLTNTTNRGSHNTAVGAFALENSNQSDNIAIGYYSLRVIGGMGENVSVGSYSMQNNQYGGGNSVLGHQALLNNNSGDYNTAIGFQAMVNNVNGSNNVAIGMQTINNNTDGARNIGIGQQSLYSLQHGNDNIGLGYLSLYSDNQGSGNIGVGQLALYNNAVGNNNISLGYQSSYNNIRGSYNVGIGWAALFNNGNSYNVGVGLQAGYHLTTQGTFLGTYADAVDGSFNVTAIGYGAQATADNQVKIGNPAVTSIGGYANWTNFSDGRYKKNIQENVPGLAFINQLKPVTYTLDIDGIENALSQKSGSANTSLPKVQASGNSGTEVSALPARNQTPQDIQAKQQKAKVVYTGFVAQDVEKAAKAVNYDFSGVDVPKNKNDFYGLRYADFVIPLVKAVQELSHKNDELSQKNDQLQEQNNQLEQRLTKLENLLNVNSSSRSVTLSNATLSQNEPNPFNGGTRIHYFIPGQYSTATIVIYDNNGKLIKNVPLTSSSGTINLDASLLSGGTYQYSLIIDGSKIDTKRMVVAK